MSSANDYANEVVRRGLVFAASLWTVTSCNVLTGADGLSTATPGMRPSSEEGAPVAPEPAPPSVDASVSVPDTGAAETSSSTCTPGSRALGVTAFDAEPAANTGETCKRANVLAEDGALAGLDRAADDLDGFIDGIDVNGCIGVEFAPGVDLGSVTVRLGPSGDACGVSPCTKCGVGREYVAFAGPSRTDLATLGGKKALPATLSSVDLAVPTGRQARVVVVCRVGWGPGEDDVVVDFIAGTCR